MQKKLKTLTLYWGNSVIDRHAGDRFALNYYLPADHVINKEMLDAITVMRALKSCQNRAFVDLQGQCKAGGASQLTVQR